MSARPNIVLVVMDSVRAANVSTYGYGRATTPTLDRLAAEGTLYERAISPGCWTLPVHATLFTGLYAATHGVTVSRDALPDGVPTLARLLADAGYDTACFSNNPYVSTATGLAQGFGHLEDLWRATRPRGTAKPRGQALTESLQERGPSGRAAAATVRTLVRARSRVRRFREWSSTADSGAARTNERIAAWLDERGARGRPFFVFVNYMEAHERYRPPHPFNERFVPGPFARLRAARLGSKSDILAAARAGRTGGLEVVRGLYDGALAYLDSKLGELLDALAARSRLDEIAVVLTSDHGDSLGEHAHLGHRLSLYEPLVHVPLVVRYPERFPPGERVSRLVSLGDLHPTLLELAGVRPEQAAFRSLLADGPARSTVVAENTAPRVLGGVEMRMARGERHKLITKSTGERELYDLVADPGETRNLAADGEPPPAAAALEGELRAWEASLGGSRLETREADFDEETAQRLRGLGYIG